MSTGSTSAYVGACRKDIPYPSVSNESVPSLIDNLVTALYGEFTKSVVNRRVQWNIPCDPVSAPATVFGLPRNAGEGLLCYFIRAFNAANNGGATFYGSFVGPLTGNATTATKIKTARNFSITGDATAAVQSFDGSANVILDTTITNLPDSSLANITTTGKVANSATTATNENTASTIVARDASGNFSAGAITASLLGNATRSTHLLGGALNSIPYQTAANTTAFLSAGANGQVLGLLSGALAWVSGAAASTASAIAGGAAGQVHWQSASNTTGFTAAGTSGQVLISNGTNAPTWSTNIGGNAGTATTLANGKTIALTGDVTGTSLSFNGSANASIPVTLSGGSVSPAKLSTGGPSWNTGGSLTLLANADIIVGAGGLSNSSALRTGQPSPVSVRQEFGTDGSGWQYRIAKNELGTVTDIVTVDDNERVGIGTTLAGAKLEVNETAAANGIRVAVGNGAYSGNVASFGVTGKSNGYQITKDAVNNINHIFNVTNNVEAMRINSSGNVGIGTPSPDTQVHMRTGTSNLQLDSDYGGSGNSYLVATGGNNGLLVGTNDAKPLTFFTSATGRLSIGSTGIIDAGSNPIQNCSTTAKAWAVFDGDTSPYQVFSGYNVTSVTRVASTNFWVNFTTPRPDVNYAPQVSMSYSTTANVSNGIPTLGGREVGRFLVYAAVATTGQAPATAAQQISVVVFDS